VSSANPYRFRNGLSGLLGALYVGGFLLILAGFLPGVSSGFQINGRSMSRAEAQASERELTEMMKGVTAEGIDKTVAEAKPKTEFAKAIQTFVLRQDQIETALGEAITKHQAKLLDRGRLKTQAGRKASLADIDALEKAVDRYQADSHDNTNQIANLTRQATGKLPSALAPSLARVDNLTKASHRLYGTYRRFFEFLIRKNPPVQDGDLTFDAEDFKAYRQLATEIGKEEESYQKMIDVADEERRKVAEENLEVVKP